MKKIYILSTLINIFLFFSLEALTSKEMKLLEMKQGLEIITANFDATYAPKEWKRSFCGWEVYLELEKAKSFIDNHPDITLKEYHQLLRKFFMSVKDYHVKVRFFSTERANLPITIHGAEGRYFIKSIPNLESLGQVPYKVGDEVLSFDGRPINDVIQDLQTELFGDNNSATDRKLTEKALVNRVGSLGMHVPSGSVVVEIKERSTKKRKIKKVVLNWNYSREEIAPPFNYHNGLVARPPAKSKNTQKNSLKELATHSDHALLKAEFVSNFAKEFSDDKGKGYTSYIPSLGEIVWEAPEDGFFTSYLYKDARGRKIGYIRLPYYSGKVLHAKEFGILLNFFQGTSEALVIDQVDNFGGSVAQLYAMLSMLAIDPISVPKHKIALTQSEVMEAIVEKRFVALIKEQCSITGSSDFLKILEEEFGGYPVSFDLLDKLELYADQIIDNWNQGRIVTDYIALFGIDEIIPHPAYRYDKPVLVLIDELDFSGGDFFPAILQDTKRAVIMGTKTAGAGGFVLSCDWPNRLGIQNFTLTGSIAERLNVGPIENLGVTPDVSYKVTASDLKTNYEPYKAEIQKALDSMLP